jgi:hypothetical protein
MPSFVSSSRSPELSEEVMISTGMCRQNVLRRKHASTSLPVRFGGFKSRSSTSGLTAAGSLSARSRNSHAFHRRRRREARPQVLDVRSPLQPSGHRFCCLRQAARLFFDRAGCLARRERFLAPWSHTQDHRRKATELTWFSGSLLYRDPLSRLSSHRYERGSCSGRDSTRMLIYAGTEK